MAGIRALLTSCQDLRKRAQRLRKSSHDVPTYENRTDGHENKSSRKSPAPPSKTKTAYLCVYIRMNGTVVLLACLSFLLRPSSPSSPSTPFCSPMRDRRDFIQKYFWMAAIDVCGALRRFALLEIRVSSNCVFISCFFCLNQRDRSFWLSSPLSFSLLFLCSHTRLTYAKNIIPRWV